MSLSIQNCIGYWSTQSLLTNLIPANKVWLDLPSNSQALPYVVFSQIAQLSAYFTKGDRIAKLKFQISIYTTTLASLGTIRDAVVVSYLGQSVTPTGTWCSLDSEVPRSEVGGAYSISLSFTLWENF